MRFDYDEPARPPDPNKPWPPRQTQDCPCSNHTHFDIGDHVRYGGTDEEGIVVDRAYSETGDVDIYFQVGRHLTLRYYECFFTEIE